MVMENMGLEVKKRTIHSYLYSPKYPFWRTLLYNACCVHPISDTDNANMQIRALTWNVQCETASVGKVTLEM